MNENDKLAYSVEEFMQAAGIGSRSTIYKEISSGRLKTVQVGRRRLIPKKAADEWFDLLYQESDKPKAAS